MKTLYIIRHAKSSWTFDLPDHDRPLGIKGRSDVMRIGQYLSANEPTPDLMITSPASRALYTALFIADEWGYPEEQIVMDESLYHATSEHILSVLMQLGDVSAVAIFGHNPGFTDLVNHFAADYLDNLPTAGVFALSLDIEDWAGLDGASSKTKFVMMPKRLPK